jgi:hypothetical protein
MADIFVSYARADKVRAVPIVDLLTSNGWSVWWDPDILPGDTYRELIDRELAAAKCVLVLWTDISINSHWVRDEAEKGKDTGRLIPIILDNVEQPLGFRQVQGLDFRSWNYKEDHAAARLLVTAVERKVAPPSSQIIEAKKENTEKSQQELRPPISPEDQSDVLLGIAIDTSGSMQGSINNDTGRVMSRLESVQDALRVMGTAVQNQAKLNTSISRSFRIFAYAFGLRHGDVCDLISVVRASKGVDITVEVDRLRQKHEAEARRSAAEYGGLAGLARSYGFGGIVDSAISAAAEQVKARIAGEIGALLLHNARKMGDSIATPQELVDLFGGASSGPQLRDLEPLIYGSTPMAAAAKEILERFKRIPNRTASVTTEGAGSWLFGRSKGQQAPPKERERRFLIIVSDGAPTDGDPRPSFNELKKMGVEIVSCFVTSADIADPRRLIARPDDRWTFGARLMWDAASEIEPEGEFAQYLVSQGWRIDRRSKCFIQANHSTVISEFIRIAGTFFGCSNADLPAKGV